MFLISAFLVFAAIMLFAILFIDEDTFIFINVTIAIGVIAYFLIAVALVIVLM